MNKAIRILENMSLEDRERIVTDLGEISENVNIERQAQYINDLLNYTETNNLPIQNTMQKCGGNCLGKEAIELAKSIYEKSSTMEEFLTGMNERGIGGGNLHIEHKKVIAIYKNCYCDIPYEVKKLNPLYCHCSAGWFQRLFSEVLGKPVSVKMINTITNGANECTFEIDCL